MAWPAGELWGTMHIRRSPYLSAFLEHDLEAYGRTEKRCRMGVGGRVGGTASSRTTTVPNGKLRGGRRKQRRPDGRRERARSLAKRIGRNSRSAGSRTRRAYYVSRDFDVGPCPTHPRASASSLKGGGDARVIARGSGQVAIFAIRRNVQYQGLVATLAC